MSRQSYKKTTKQIRVDTQFHKKLKVEAARRGISIKGLLEEKSGWISEEEKKNKNK